MHETAQRKIQEIAFTLANSPANTEYSILNYDENGEWDTVLPKKKRQNFEKDFQELYNKFQPVALKVKTYYENQISKDKIVVFDDDKFKELKLKSSENYPAVVEADVIKQNYKESDFLGRLEIIEQNSNFNNDRIQWNFEKREYERQLAEAKEKLSKAEKEIEELEEENEELAEIIESSNAEEGKMKQAAMLAGLGKVLGMGKKEIVSLAGFAFNGGGEGNVSGLLKDDTETETAAIDNSDDGLIEENTEIQKIAKWLETLEKDQFNQIAQIILNINKNKAMIIPLLEKSTELLTD